VPLFVGHASPLFIEPEKGAQKFSALLQKLSREVGLYKVSSFRKTMKAGIYDDRVYLIEARSGSLACFRLVFRKVLGKWYVGTYRISGDEEASFKLLDLPLPKAIL
jgi:hypothetical protein